MPSCFRPIRMVVMIAAGALVPGSMPRICAQDRLAAGDWEVRRLRTVDAEKAGGYPEWQVMRTEATPGIDVSIDESDGASRGHILIGKPIIPPADRPVRITFSYTTSCGLDHRSGNLALAIFEPDAWNRLPTEPRTDVLSGSEETRPVWQWIVHAMTEADVSEPIPLDEDSMRALAQALRSYAGRTMVAAISWMGAHRAIERATIHNLHIEEGPPMLPEKELIASLDLDNPQLQAVAEAAAENDYERAMRHLIRHFTTRWPEAPKTSKIHRSKHDADMALQNRFRSIGSDQYYTLRKEFDWDRNAIDDKEWLLHLQWHDFLVTLVSAGAVTGDEQYATKAIELIRDWIPRNYPGARWSWRTLEVSLRALKWARIYPHLLHAERFTLTDHAEFLNTLREHLDYLLPEERFHSGHNFGATECNALLRVAIVFPEFTHAETWRHTAWTRLEGEMTDQVLPDGAQKELTCGYHNSVTNTFFRAAQWVEGTDLEPSETYWRQLERMHEYTAYLTKPDGTQPNVGDTWSNRQGPLVERGGTFFNRPDLLFIGSHGARGTRPDYLDRALPAAGYYAMRTSWPDDPDGIYLFLDAARQWGGWHSHYDALSIILYAYGRTLTPDAGPFAYGNPLRSKFQSTAFHSTVCVNNQNQNREGCRIHAFTSDPRLTFADAEHPGYETVTHRRQILFVRPGYGMPPYFVLLDRLSGTGAHRMDLHFHLPAGEVDTHTEHLTASTRERDTGNLRIVGMQTGEIVMEARTSWIMTGYAQKTERPNICFSREGPLPALFVTLLVPFKGNAAPLLTASLVNGSSAAAGVAVSVTSEDGTRDVVFAGTDPSGGTVGDLSWSGAAGLERRTADERQLCRVIMTGD